MKRYIRSSRECYVGEYNYRRGYNRPGSESIVELIGKSLGGMDIFYLSVQDAGEGFFVGAAPRGFNINLFDEFSWDLKEVFSIDGHTYPYDDQLVSAVNAQFMRIVNNHHNQELFNSLHIELLDEPWHIWSDRLYIGDPEICAITRSDFQQGTYRARLSSTFIHQNLDKLSGTNWNRWDD